MDLLIGGGESRKVWIPNHPEHAYIPGRVEEAAGDGKLLLVDDDGLKFTIEAKDAQSVDPACLAGVDDLLMLGDFNEAALLHNIRVRYAEDKIYTGIGSPILISVNPYQAIKGLYDEACQVKYRRGGAARAAGQNVNLPPHLYSVVDAAYRTILKEQLNQSIIISGESGAGKTEATKRILTYLAEMQRAGFSSGEKSVEQQVLDANPVLEAFGNAKTVRNDNSSRFGKFVEVEFDSSGRLTTAQISNYLLEKSRIVQQQPEERNYHIFYQLCAGVGSMPSLAPVLKLGPAEDFEYSSMCTDIAGVDDRSDFTEVLECMTSLGFSLEERASIFKLVAAVLHLGNVEFSVVARDGDDGVRCADAAQPALISELLSVDLQQLNDVFEYKTIEDPLNKKHVIRRPQGEKSASYTRHSLVKVAYARLFDWLVWRINSSITAQGKAGKDLRRIGLLDIYGFEVFEWNSFEQLCINFANEKLQQHFNTHMFSLEQKLYSSEGIKWSHINFQDNQHIIDTLEKKPLGLFCLVDEQCLMPSSKQNPDLTLLGKIEKQYFKKSQVVYKPGRVQSNEFAVAHYAGEVVYNVETFIEKNTDKLHADITNLLKASNDELIKSLFTDPRFNGMKGAEKAPAPNTSSKRKSGAGRTAKADGDQRQRQNVTVGMMFREQLDKLVEDLNKTHPRYIRCIKPNANKQPLEFDSPDVLRQLRCAGMLEAIRIRRAGYAVRRPFKEFFTRFRILTPNLVAVGADPDYRSLSQRLATEVEARLLKEGTELDEKPWQLGQTRVFLKEELERHLERLLVESARKQMTLVQSFWRGYVQRKRYQATRAAIVELQAALRTRVAAAAYKQLLRRHKAVVELQAALRGAAVRAAFVKRREAALCIQRFARGWRCRSKIGKVRGKMAAEKVRKLREEQERNAALQQAREDAREKEREMEAYKRELEEQKEKALEEVRREKEENEKKVHFQNQSGNEELQRLRAEKEELAARLRDAEEATSKALAAPQEMTSDRVMELEEQVYQLKTANLRAKQELAEATVELDATKSRASDLELQVKELKSKAATGVQAAALTSLRSEIMDRIGQTQRGGPEGEAAPPAPGTAGCLLGQSLRRVDIQGMGLERGGPASNRNTIICQREAFEKLKDQFADAQQELSEALRDGVDSVVLNVEGFDIEDNLEETRRLKKLNVDLQTKLLSAQEEAAEKADEASSMLEKMSQLKAELQDVSYKHKSEIRDLQQRLEEALATLRQQTEQMSRLNIRAQDAEGLCNKLQNHARQADGEQRAANDKLSKTCVDLEQQLSITKKERAELESRVRSERDRFTGEMRAKEAELENTKRVLEEMIGKHVPSEEMEKWKKRANFYEHECQKAMRYNKELSSGVGNLARGVSERGGEVQELQQRNLALIQAQEKKDQQISMLEMEKADLQKQLDSLTSSCDYFQRKYKQTNSELKAAKASSSPEATAQVTQENTDLKRQLVVLRNRFDEAEKEKAARGNGTAPAEGAGGDSQQLRLVAEGIASLWGMHNEQARLWERAKAEIKDTSLQAAVQEKGEMVHASLMSLKSLVDGNSKGKSAAGASSGTYVPQPRQPTQQHPSQQHQQQMLMQKQQQMQYRQGQAMQQYPQGQQQQQAPQQSPQMGQSLLTQMNLSQRPGFN